MAAQTWHSQFPLAFHNTPWTADRAIDWLKFKRDEDKPFVQRTKPRCHLRQMHGLRTLRRNPARNLGAFIRVGSGLILLKNSSLIEGVIADSISVLNGRFGDDGTEARSTGGPVL